MKRSPKPSGGVLANQTREHSGKQEEVGGSTEQVRTAESQFWNALRQYDQWGSTGKGEEQLLKTSMI